MVATAKLGIAAGIVVVGAALAYPLRGPSAAGDAPLATDVASSPADTTAVKLAIRGMTCGSCATTARIALERTRGVYSAQVFFDAAEAVVRYDPHRTAPDVFMQNLNRLTGYQARVLDTPGVDPHNTTSSRKG